MRGLRRAAHWALCIGLSSIAACSPTGDVPLPGAGSADSAGSVGSAAALSVYVVNYPLLYFAERIAGDAAQVTFPAPPIGDPAFWLPGPAAIAEFQAADLIVRNGATYAKWMDLVTLPESKIVDTSAAFANRLITIDDAMTHSHGPEAEHSHGDTAFTTWLDPTQAIEQARAIRDAFVAARPEQESTFVTNFAALQSDLEELDQRLTSLTRDAGEMPLLASHPVYQYLARRYELNVVSVHFEAEEMPEEAAWRDLEQIVGSHPARWMIWEGRPADEIVDRLMSLGITSVVYDPAGNRPTEGDFMAVMRQNVLNLQRIFARLP